MADTGLHEPPRDAVPYASALEQLLVMFTDFDVEVVAAVLQANQGHLERTVECLLAMSSNDGDATGNSQTVGEERSAQGGHASSSTSLRDDALVRRERERADEELARRLQAQFDAEEQGGGDGHATRGIRGYETTGVSPANFEPGGVTNTDTHDDPFDVAPLSDALASVGTAIGQGLSWLGEAFTEAVADPQEPESSSQAGGRDGAGEGVTDVDADAVVVEGGSATTREGTHRHRSALPTSTLPTSSVAAVPAAAAASDSATPRRDNKKDV